MFPSRKRPLFDMDDVADVCLSICIGTTVQSNARRPTRSLQIHGEVNGQSEVPQDTRIEKHHK
jgi:hypothetical protein